MKNLVLPLAPSELEEEEEGGKELWFTKTCFLEMFLSFHKSYGKRFNYRDFLMQVLLLYEKTCGHAEDAEMVYEDPQVSNVDNYSYDCDTNKIHHNSVSRIDSSYNDTVNHHHSNNNNSDDIERKACNSSKNSSVSDNSSPNNACNSIDSEMVQDIAVTNSCAVTKVEVIDQSEEQMADPEDVQSSVTAAGPLALAAALKAHFPPFPATLCPPLRCPSSVAAAVAAAAAAAAANSAERRPVLPPPALLRPPATRAFTCLLCGRGFSRKEHLLRHERIHTDDRPFPCPVCPRRFRRQDCQRKHVRAHHRHLVTPPWPPLTATTAATPPGAATFAS